MWCLIFTLFYQLYKSFWLSEHQVEHIVTNFPFAEISIIRDFNVHHQLWHLSPSTDEPGGWTRLQLVPNDLGQLIQHPTCIPDRLGGTPSRVKSRNFSNPKPFNLLLLKHTLLWVPPTTISFFLYPAFSLLYSLWAKQTRLSLWHFDSDRWEYSRTYSSDFEWNDYTPFRSETSLCVASALHWWLS